MNKIAFLVLAHNEPMVLKRMVGHLSKIGDVFIHLDSKADIQCFEAVAGNIIKHRINVCWAGWSMIEATMHLLQSASSKNKYEKYVLLSGQDYPIKPVDKIRDTILDISGNMLNSVEIANNSSQDVYFQHIKKYYNYDSFSYTNVTIFKKPLRYIINRFLNLFKKDLKGAKFFQSSQWFVLDHDTVKYCIEEFHMNRFLVRVLKTSFAPDEYFFATIVNNSGIHETNILETEEIGTHLKANIHVIDKSLSKYFTKDDIEVLIDSEHLFVRKVNLELSKDLIDILDDII